MDIQNILTVLLEKLRGRRDTLMDTAGADPGASHQVRARALDDVAMCVRETLAGIESFALCQHVESDAPFAGTGETTPHGNPKGPTPDADRGPHDIVEELGLARATAARRFQEILRLHEVLAQVKAIAHVARDPSSGKEPMEALGRIEATCESVLP